MSPTNDFFPRTEETIDSLHAPVSAQPLPSIAAKWKARGDDLLQDAKRKEAREAYLSGLRVCTRNDENVKKELKLGVLEIDFRDGEWENAIIIGNQIVKEFPEDAAALLSLARAHYAARQFENAFNYYVKYYRTQPTDAENVDEMKRIETRMKERKGQFILTRLIRTSKECPLEELDCADYEGPIEIKEIAGKGRGLVLTKDVEENSILLVSKAVACSLQPASSAMDDDVLLKLMLEMVDKLTAKINRNPNLFGPPVFDLCSHPHPELERKHIPDFSHPDFRMNPFRDVGTLQNICYLNHRVLWRWRSGHLDHQGIGLFLVPSYFNHDCRPNAYYTFYNDVMVVTSVRDLKAGTELTINYANKNWTCPQRTDYLNEFGLDCYCSKCQIEYGPKCLCDKCKIKYGRNE